MGRESPSGVTKGKIIVGYVDCISKRIFTGGEKVKMNLLKFY